MAHRAALYKVRVKEKWRDYRLLGDIDESGTSLLSVLDRYLADFESTSADGERVVRCLQHATVDNELVVTMLHGQTGVAADIVDVQGENRLRQVVTDSQNLRCGCLFKLPPDADTGWLAIQVNAGRGIKGLLEIGLYDKFQNQFSDLKLELRPFVRATALTDAIDAGMLSKVKLIRYEKPNDRAVSATNKWVKGNEFGKLELDITMRGRGKKLKADLLKKYFHGDQAALSDIIEFAGISFEQAKVEVEVDGTIRTFNLETPTSGHPMTVELEDLAYDDDGEPTADSVVAGLRDTLKMVA